MADLIELRNRILAVHNGTLPPDAVSQDELREAIAQLREDRRRRATTATESRSTPARKAAPSIDLNAVQGTKGGLLDLLANTEE